MDIHGKSNTRNEAPNGDVGLGNLRQNATRRTAHKGVNILANEEKHSYGAPYSVRTHKFLYTLIRDTDVPHIVETPRRKLLFDTLELSTRIMMRLEGTRQESIQDCYKHENIRLLCEIRRA